MVYDEGLAERIRVAVGGRPGIVEKKMFGGVGFLLHGNMCCGVSGTELIVRTNPAEYERFLAEPDTRVFDMTGRPMKGWIVVEPGGLASEDGINRWVQRGVEFAESLPAK